MDNNSKFTQEKNHGKIFKIIDDLAWRAGDAQVFTGSEEGQLRVRDADMVRICAEEEGWIYWKKDAGCMDVVTEDRS